MNSPKKPGSRAAATKRDDPEQSHAFIEKAREIEADEKAHSAADKLMGTLAKMKPEPKKNRIGATKR